MKYNKTPQDIMMRLIKIISTTYKHYKICKKHKNKTYQYFTKQPNLTHQLNILKHLR